MVEAGENSASSSCHSHRCHGHTGFGFVSRFVQPAKFGPLGPFGPQETPRWQTKRFRWRCWCCSYNMLNSACRNEMSTENSDCKTSTEQQPFEKKTLRVQDRCSRCSWKIEAASAPWHPRGTPQRLEKCSKMLEMLILPKSPAQIFPVSLVPVPRCPPLSPVVPVWTKAPGCKARTRHLSNVSSFKR